MVLVLAQTLLAVGLLTILVVLVFALTGVGQGMMFVIGWRICNYIATSNDLELACNRPNFAERAVLYISFSFALLLPRQIYRLWNHIHWTLAAHLCVGSITGIFIGQWILFSFPANVWVERALGGILFCISIEKIFGIAHTQRRRRPSSIILNPQLIAAAAAAAASSSEAGGADALQSSSSSSSSSPILDAQLLARLEQIDAAMDMAQVAGSFSMDRPTVFFKDGRRGGGGHGHSHGHGHGHGESGCGEDGAGADADNAHKRQAPTTLLEKLRRCFSAKQDLGYEPFKFDDWRKSAVVVLVGFSAGVLGGLYGASGPIFIWFVATYKMPSLECRSTFQVSFVCEVCIRLIYTYLVQTTNHTFYNIEYLWAFLVISSCSLVSLTFGNWLAARILNQALFSRLLVALLCGGSILITVSTLPKRAAAEAAGSMLAVFVVIYVFVVHRVQRRMQKLLGAWRLAWAGGGGGGGAGAVGDVCRAKAKARPRQGPAADDDSELGGDLRLQDRIPSPEEQDAGTSQTRRL